MKKILGLDVGTTSIGWAIVETTDEKPVNDFNGEQAKTDINNNRLGLHKDAVGVRIISQDTERFDRGVTLNDPKGSTLTPTATRRKYRSARRMRNRYKLRRSKLETALSFMGIVPDKNYYTNEKGKRGTNNDLGRAIYEIRDNAIREKISLAQFGRILLHMNQWRGYSSDRFQKEEKPRFDYYTGIITNISDKPIQIDYEKNDKTKINWLHYSISIDLNEPIKINDEESIEKFVDARVFVKEAKDLTIKTGEVITFKFDLRQEKRKGEVVNQYYQIKKTTPDPTDWNYRYQTLHKNLTEWCESGGTVGSYFYKNFYEEKVIERIRNNVVNRNWYENELDRIFDKQYGEHKEFFESIEIDDLVKVTFKDYEPILHDVKTKETIKEQLRCFLKEKIIFYQRPWQQSKNKGECTFEKILVKKSVTEKGTGEKKEIEVYKGRTVIPRSHPLFQEFKIWQQINNVKIFLNAPEGKIDLFNHPSEFEKHIGKSIPEVKNQLYKLLQHKKEISWRSFVKDKEEGLGIDNVLDERNETSNKKIKIKKKSELTAELPPSNFFTVNFRKKKRDGSYDDIKLKGNSTKVAINNILKHKDEFWFDSIIKEGKDNHQKEILEKFPLRTNEYKVTKLQLLWELIYDITISDPMRVTEKIRETYPDIEQEDAISLTKIKFVDSGMGNLSAKAIRQILPLMSNGEHLTEKARKKIDSLIELNNSTEEKSKADDEKLETLRNLIADKKARLKLSRFSSVNDFTYLNYWEAAAVIYGSHSSKRIFISRGIKPISFHSLNNPIVEKIVNETISIINEIYKRYGFDEVRIELSRELKASIEERQQMWEAMTFNAERNEWAKQMLRELKAESSELDVETSNNSNLDKIKIIEDVVKFTEADEYKMKYKEYKLGEPSKAEVKKYLMWLEQRFRCPYTNQPIQLTDVFSKNKTVEIEHIIPKERYYLDSYSNKVITWKEVNQLKSDRNRTAYEFIVSKRGIDKIKLSNGKEISLVAADKWENHVKEMFPAGAKRNNLLRKEIPEDPINRTLKETQYINKKLKEKLAELIGEQKIWITSGSVTDILRERWHLNKQLKELLRERFEKFNPGEQKEKLNLTYWTKQYNSKTGEYEDVEVFEGYSKKLDHRHHALDAIIIACTKQNHIQYINTLNAVNTADQQSDESRKKKYEWLKKNICENNSSKKFIMPWNNFIVDIKKAMNEIVVSHKNTRLLISPSKHRMGKAIKSIPTASIRGELHKETNYARKNYFEKEKTQITTLIPLLIKKKIENRDQTMVHFKTFEEIIKETVLKEKYQKILIQLFSKYDIMRLNKDNHKEIAKIILEAINTSNLLVNSETNMPLTELSTYSEKDKSCRPNGLYMNLNNEKEIKDIANPRIKRIAAYRLAFINKKKEEIDKLGSDKKEKDELKKEAESLPLYSNAIYEVRVEKGKNNFEWIELQNLCEDDFNNIKYARQNITRIVKEKILEVGLDKLKKEYFDNPIFISKQPIPIKKARQKAYFQDLYEITKGRYVYSLDTFMVYFLVDKNIDDEIKKREIKFLKFIDAIGIIDAEKPRKIDCSKLIGENTNYNLLFTLSKNDMVYIPKTVLSKEELDNVDWEDIKTMSPYLYVVKDMNPSLKKILFQHVNKADSIKINEADAKSLFKNSEMKEQVEEIKYGTVDMMQRCIKVFTDKLGKKIVPYWEFPNGCWDCETAKRVGLLIDNRKNGD